jgi:serine/threonine protein kinase
MSRFEVREKAVTSSSLLRCICRWRLHCEWGRRTIMPTGIRETGCRSQICCRVWRLGVLVIGSPGQIGPFEVVSEIGRGGMGVVYLARQPSLDRLVAVKVLGVRDPELSQRLRREAELLSELQHPHIVSVLDVGEENGDPYYAMTYCSGGSIAKLLERDGRLSPGQASTVLVAVSEALAALHARGFVHRDVKPSNVLLSGDGDPYLGDFGLALSGDASRVTTSGAVLGTIGYSAPELLENAAAGAGTDVFSLGVLGYQMLSGQLPFRGDHLASVLDAVRSGRHVPLAEVAPDTPSALAVLVQRAMATDPSDRPDDLREFARQLRAAVPTAAIIPIAPPPDDLTVRTRAKHTSDETIGSHRRDPVSLVTGSSAVETDRRHTKRTRIFALAVVAALVVAAVAVAVDGSNGPKRVAAARLTKPPVVPVIHAYRLDSFDYRNGVTVSEVWTATGANNQSLHSAITVENTSGAKVVQTEDIVIPKSVATTLADVRLGAPHYSVVRMDPIVRYCLTLPAHTQRVLTYQATPPAGAVSSHFAAWASDWRELTKADFAAHTGKPCKGAPKKTPRPKIDAKNSGAIIPITPITGLAAGTTPTNSSGGTRTSVTATRRRGIHATAIPPTTQRRNEVPTTSSRVTSPPATSPPATSPPATSPPATSPPATSPPATSPPVTTPPTTPRTTPRTTPPTAPTPLVGDITGDGKVGCEDFAILSSEYGESGSGLPADLNHDGVVNLQDFSILAGHFTGDGTTYDSPTFGSCTNAGA